MSSDAAQVVSVVRNAENIGIELYIQPELACFDGHFPGHPILPGVIQTHWAIGYGREYFGIGGTFRALNHVKFMKVIVPGIRVTLQLVFDAEKGLLKFRYDHGGVICSQGTVVFAI